MNSRPSRVSPRLLSVAVLLTLAALPIGCRQPASQAENPPPPQVTIAPVAQEEIVLWDEITGRTAAIEFVEVRPRVSGHLDRVLFESGQRVKKGDVLFEIDARWHKADLERREAELAMAQIRVENAEREAQRNVQLLASRAISKEEADAREARFAEARAALLVAKAARDSTQLDLDHTQVRSPINGQVSRALVTAGNYVSGLAGGATLLTTVVSVDPVHVYADLDEATFLRFNALSRAGSLPRNSNGKVPVELRLADESGFTRLGYVESLDNRLDERTGSIVVRAQFPNSDGLILPGLFAHLRLPGGAREPALLIDETSIGTDQAQKFVLSLTSSNTTAYRPIKLGPMYQGRRVVREGLQAGEKIIVNGLARVRPGMPVSPVEATGSPHKEDVRTAAR